MHIYVYEKRKKTGKRSLTPTIGDKLMLLSTLFQLYYTGVVVCVAWTCYAQSDILCLKHVPAPDITKVHVEDNMTAIVPSASCVEMVVWR